jgi:hypothetical protein
MNAGGHRQVADVYGAAGGRGDYAGSANCGEERAATA